MTAKERLSFFYELINCNYELYHWEYDADFNLLSTNWTNSLFSKGFLKYTGLEKIIREFLAGESICPVILEIECNLLRISCFELREDGYHTHLAGPVFSGRDSLMLVRRRLDSYELSVNTRASVFRCFEHIPAIPLNVLSQYAVMLHYCLTDQKTSVDEIRYLSTIRPEQKSSYQPDEKRHAGIRYAEEQLLNMISEGDPRYKEALKHSGSLSSGMKSEIGDSLRQHKNNMIVLLTLCSRACMKGGLSAAIAYDLNDYYAQRLEACNSMTELSALSSEMLEHYVAQVRKAREQSHISAPIRDACYFIKTNITSELSLKNLAARAGYAEYYFSHKFKQETGLSVNEYILNEKLEQARLLLTNTAESIQSISDRLNFGSRSHFYTCFQKETGCSPSEFRKANGKL